MPLHIVGQWADLVGVGFPGWIEEPFQHLLSNQLWSRFICCCHLSLRTSSRINTSNQYLQQSRIKRMGMPKFAPLQYNFISECSMQEIRSRLLVLYNFSDLISSSWRFFNMSNFQVVDLYQDVRYVSPSLPIYSSRVEQKMREILDGFKCMNYAYKDIKDGDHKWDKAKSAICWKNYIKYSITLLSHLKKSKWIGTE